MRGRRRTRGEADEHGGDDNVLSEAEAKPADAEAEA